ncbi:hypothetical protein S1R3Y_000013 [Vibrio phage vB_ValP_VA-RY-3]|nr:hypothetical protein S1R3Y_000013 [Vibrio phage vB_ValP_VA-RY-3]
MKQFEYPVKKTTATIMTKRQYKRSLLKQKRDLTYKLNKLVEKYHG